MSYPESTDVTPRPYAVPIQTLLVAYMHTWLTGVIAPDGVTDYGTVGVGIAVPNPTPPLYVCLWRAGGRISNPLIYSRIYAPDDATLDDLGGHVHVGLLAAAAKVPSVLICTDESFPTRVVDDTSPPFLFGSVSLLLAPF